MLVIVCLDLVSRRSREVVQSLALLGLDGNNVGLDRIALGQVGRVVDTIDAEDLDAVAVVPLLVLADDQSIDALAHLLRSVLACEVSLPTLDLVKRRGDIGLYAAACHIECTIIVLRSLDALRDGIVVDGQLVEVLDIGIVCVGLGLGAGIDSTSLCVERIDIALQISDLARERAIGSLGGQFRGRSEVFGDAVLVRLEIVILALIGEAFQGGKPLLVVGLGTSVAVVALCQRAVHTDIDTLVKGFPLVLCSLLQVCDEQVGHHAKEVPVGIEVAHEQLRLLVVVGTDSVVELLHVRKGVVAHVLVEASHFLLGGSELVVVEVGKHLLQLDSHGRIDCQVEILLVSLDLSRVLHGLRGIVLVDIPKSGRRGIRVGGSGLVLQVLDESGIFIDVLLGSDDALHIDQFLELLRRNILVASNLDRTLTILVLRLLHLGTEGIVTGEVVSSDDSVVFAIALDEGLQTVEFDLDATVSLADRHVVGGGQTLGIVLLHQRLLLLDALQEIAELTEIGLQRLRTKIGSVEQTVHLIPKFLFQVEFVHLGFIVGAVIISLLGKHLEHVGKIRHASDYLLIEHRLILIATVTVLRITRPGFTSLVGILDGLLYSLALLEVHAVGIGEQSAVIGGVRTIRLLVDTRPHRIESTDEAIVRGIVIFRVIARAIGIVPNIYLLSVKVFLQLLVGIIVGRGVGGHLLERIGLQLQVVETTGDALDDMALGIIAILA